MATLNEFAKRITVVAANLEDGVERLIRRVALAADAAVVTATPVDTGRARANWIASVGQAVRFTVEPTDRSGQSALDQAAGEVAKFDLSHGAIFLSNNLPYIQRLNDGWSRQAPAGFVERAVLAGVAAIDGARVLGS